MNSKPHQATSMGQFFKPGPPAPSIVFTPMHVSLRMEAKHIARPQFLLALWSPSFLPSKMTSHWCHMRIVLWSDWTCFPTIPLSHTAPWGQSRIGHDHPLTHDAFHHTARQQHKPWDGRDEEQGTDVEPGSHIHIHLNGRSCLAKQTN